MYQAIPDLYNHAGTVSHPASITGGSVANAHSVVVKRQSRQSVPLEYGKLQFPFHSGSFGADDVKCDEACGLSLAVTHQSSAVCPQSATSVHVSNANAPAADHLVVGGYDVSGEVRSDGEPMKEVTFLLYSATVKKEVSRRWACLNSKDAS